MKEKFIFSSVFLFINFFVFAVSPEISFTVGENVTDLHVFQTYKNEVYAFYVQDNAIKEINPENQINVIYESPKTIESISFYDCVFGPVIAVTESKDSNLFLSCILFDAEMKEERMINLESSVTLVTDINFIYRKNVYYVYALVDNCLINYTIEFFENKERLLLSEKVKSYKVDRDNDLITGYIFKQEKDKGKLIYFVKDELMSFIDLDRNVDLIKDYQHYFMEDYLDQLLIKDENGYELLLISYDKKINYEIKNLYDNADFNAIKVLDYFTNLSRNEYCIIYKGYDELVYYLFIKQNSIYTNKFLCNDADEISLIPYFSDELLFTEKFLLSIKTYSDNEVYQDFTGVYLLNFENAEITEITNNTGVGPLNYLVWCYSENINNYLCINSYYISLLKFNDDLTELNAKKRIKFNSPEDDRAVKKVVILDKDKFLILKNRNIITIIDEKIESIPALKYSVSRLLNSIICLITYDGLKLNLFKY